MPAMPGRRTSATGTGEGLVGWLIDDRGRVWSAESHPITHGSPGPDTISYAVTDLGFIHLRAEQSALRLGFNPRRVSRAAVVAAFYIIAEVKPQRVLLWYGNEDRDVEIAGATAQAIDRIEELVCASPPVQRPVFQTRRLSLDRAWEAGRESAAVLLRAWAELGGELSRERQDNLFHAGMLDTGLIVRNPAASDRLVIEHWGSARDLLGPRWLRIARGREVEDQPFRELGQRVAATYRAVLADGRPRLHRVRTILPQANGQLAGRQYERLLLPWRGPERERLLTGVNFLVEPLAL
jgi:hypothetical protein